MGRRTFLSAIGVGALVTPLTATAQQTTRIYRVGVVLEGGPYYAIIDGLKAGLRELGFVEGKHYALLVRDVKGDVGALDGAAKDLEQDNVDLIYATATSVTRAVQRSTRKSSIVFNVGTDPVSTGLVKSFANPGGRLTGVYTRSMDLVSKRLQILQEAVPKVHRIVCFYQPENPGARISVAQAREAAPKLGFALVERQISSVDDLRARLRELKTEEADAIFQVLDAMVNSQSALIAEAALAKKLPTMFNEPNAVAAGGLLGYGVNLYTMGRLTETYVQRVLLGTSPAALPVEGFDKLELTINLKTAKALGLTIPQSVLLRADDVIQ